MKMKRLLVLGCVPMMLASCSLGGFKEVSKEEFVEKIQAIAKDMVDNPDKVPSYTKVTVVTELSKFEISETSGAEGGAELVELLKDSIEENLKEELGVGKIEVSDAKQIAAMPDRTLASYSMMVGLTAEHGLKGEPKFYVNGNATKAVAEIETSQSGTEMEIHVVGANTVEADEFLFPVLEAYDAKMDWGYSGFNLHIEYCGKTNYTYTK